MYFNIAGRVGLMQTSLKVEPVCCLFVLFFNMVIPRGASKQRTSYQYKLATALHYRLLRPHQVARVAMRDLNEWNLLYCNDGHNGTNGLTVFLIMPNLITLAY